MAFYTLLLNGVIIYTVINLYGQSVVILMKEVWIKSISEYLNILEELADVYRSYPLMKSGFVFRGMEDHSYKLLPSVYREVIDDVDGININNSKYLAFVDEKSILHEFLQDAAAYVPQLDIHEYVRWIELAQHHGVPTRFLDWTENPLVALYFACESNSDCDAVIWILHKANYFHYASNQDENLKKNIYKSKDEAIRALLTTPESEKEKYSKLWKFPYIYKPYYFNNRMSAQASWFMVWGTQKEALEDLTDDTCYMKYNSQKANYNISTGRQSEQFLFRFFVYKEQKQEIIRQLDHMGIHAKSLFPGLDGIGKRIERIFRFDYNESIRKL